MKALSKLAVGANNVGLVEVEKPLAEAGEVVIEVVGTGICGTDLHIQDDEFASVPPVVMGHEVTGRIHAVGLGVDSELLELRCAVETYFYTCGKCRYCLGGQKNLCAVRRSIGSHVDGGFAQFLKVPVGNIHPVDEAVSEYAGALYEPLACVAHCLCDPAVATAGDAALVIGPGTMGLLTAQVLRAQGAIVTIVGTTQDELRLAVATSLGIGTAFSEDLGNITPPGGFDVVAECSGSAVGIDVGLNATRKGGRYVHIGLSGKSISVDLDLVCLRELTVTSGFASTPRSWWRAERLVARSLVKLDPLVTDVMPLEQWREAFRLTRVGAGVKFVLDPRPKVLK